MKTKFLLVLILLAQTFHTQDLTGSWQGEIDLGAMKLPLILNIKKDGNKYISTAKSPKQGDKTITVDRTEFANNELIFEMKDLDASYKGQLKTDHFEGTFTQRSRDFNLDLSRTNEKNVDKISKESKIEDLGSREINTKKIDDFLNYMTENKQSVGGISIFRNGKEVYQKNFGQDQLSNVKWDSNTRYQVGSVSKLFTAIMLMQQVEKGKLNLSDKLSKYFPDAPNAYKITIETMLNHTSGLGDYVGEHYQWLFKKPVGDKVILDTIKAQGVESQPGEKTRYSNSGYYLLSRILEKITKKPYNLLLKENITNKANLKNTFSVLDNPTNVFRSYKNKDGKWLEIEDFDFHNCIGLGDIVSTPNDLNLFINALFNGKLVKKETLDRMMPTSKKPLDFGLGLMAVPFYTKVSFGHGGDTAGSHSITSYNPKDDYSVSMIINGEEYPHNALGLGILSIIYDMDYTYPKFGVDATKSVDTPEKFQKYIGDYTSPDIPMDLKIFSQDGKLFAQGKGQTSFELEYVDKDEFKFVPAKIQINFFPNQLQLLQNGKTYNFTRK
ncbi:CubicO group peptidase (beta-lactamase class C family) [Epilithonimonas hungarica]|uniref:serine hydrolase domain-containing protein n=1 Tax=Epilithonimonas hungarica TaxID=454006 RepID=UPI00278293B4|nr:serine hydrolase domain-containing protein [Epilithonimonas hungarica]MDP9957731.1 CubicO group peptidase (beta-lactamase class C family) [Epilithonimonas hungarica]